MKDIKSRILRTSSEYQQRLRVGLQVQPDNAKYIEWLRGLIHGLSLSYEYIEEEERKRNVGT